MPFTREQFEVLAPAQRLPAVVAGPIVTVLIVGSCAMGARIVRSPTVLLLLLSATALTAASRLVLIMPATLVRFGPNDETEIGAALAVSPRLLWSMEFLVISTCCYFVIRGLGPSRRSLYG
jgi:hypothetical protein